MNVVTRGIKNTLRSPMRSGAMVLMLAISICLVLSMLVARSSVETKINSVKANTGTGITISPAGVMGFSGGGDALTATQLTQIKETAHISSTTASLSDQLASTDTNLTPSLELGNFGARQERFNGSSSGSTNAPSSTSTTFTPPTPRTTVTGTTDPNSVSTSGGTLDITSGSTINSNSDALEALVGTDLATKNSLKVGSTFTAYAKTITVKGIFKTDNKFQDSGIIMPLTTVQTLTSQTGSISSVKAKVDSSENVSKIVTALKSALGTKADITSEAEQAATSVSSLQSISSLALAGVIGSAIAGAAIILLMMIMIVRERRREIGVIKAIGGTNLKVVFQFMSEAITLTIIGAALGLGLGVVASGPMTNSLVSSQSSTSERRVGGPSGFVGGGLRQIGSNFSQVTSSLTPEVFIYAVSITILIAIVGSAIPAYFIARISPAEVLRSE